MIRTAGADTRESSRRRNCHDICERTVRCREQADHDDGVARRDRSPQHSRTWCGGRRPAIQLVDRGRLHGRVTLECRGPLTTLAASEPGTCVVVASETGGDEVHFVILVTATTIIVKGPATGSPDHIVTLTATVTDAPYRMQRRPGLQSQTTPTPLLRSSSTTGSAPASCLATSGTSQPPSPCPCRTGSTRPAPQLRRRRS